MLKIIPRNNAYNIAQPQTVVKLFANATQTTGSGTTLRQDQNLFTYTQALAMAFFRIAVPIDNVSMLGIDYTQPVPTDNAATYVPYPGLLPQLVQVQQQNNNQDVASSVLRSFLSKTQQVSP